MPAATRRATARSSAPASAIAGRVAGVQARRSSRFCGRPIAAIWAKKSRRRRPSTAAGVVVGAEVGGQRPRAVRAARDERSRSAASLRTSLTRRGAHLPQRHPLGGSRRLRRQSLTSGRAPRRAAGPAPKRTGSSAGEAGLRLGRGDRRAAAVLVEVARVERDRGDARRPRGQRDPLVQLDELGAAAAAGGPGSPRSRSCPAWWQRTNACGAEPWIRPSVTPE